MQWMDMTKDLTPLCGPWEKPAAMSSFERATGTAAIFGLGRTSRNPLHDSGPRQPRGVG
jgi:hypothetical protein